MTVLNQLLPDNQGLELLILWFSVGLDLVGAKVPDFGAQREITDNFQ